MQVENSATEIVGDSVGGAASLLSPENLLNIWNMAWPFLLKGVIALLILWIGRQLLAVVFSLLQLNDRLRNNLPFLNQH